jgi:hypothetical protein
VGEVILSKNVNHNGNSSETIRYKNLSKGIYNVEIKKPDGNTEIIKVLN